LKRAPLAAFWLAQKLQVQSAAKAFEKERCHLLGRLVVLAHWTQRARRDIRQLADSARQS
jgi:hypothetical protein